MSGGRIGGVSTLVAVAVVAAVVATAVTRWAAPPAAPWTESTGDAGAVLQARLDDLEARLPTTRDQPGVREALQQARQHDADEGVRSYAGRSLGGR